LCGTWQKTLHLQFLKNSANTVSGFICNFLSQELGLKLNCPVFNEKVKKNCIFAATKNNTGTAVFPQINDWELKVQNVTAVLSTCVSNVWTALKHE